MIFTSTQLPGAIVVDVQRLEDTRGWFERTYCEREFKAYGLPTGMVQASMSLTRRAGTLRGMHYQLAPHAEDKLVCCVRGGIWDAIVAHGFVTLTDDAAVTDQMSGFYTPSAERGARHDDPAFGIECPRRAARLPLFLGCTRGRSAAPRRVRAHRARCGYVRGPAVHAPEAAQVPDQLGPA